MFSTLLELVGIVVCAVGVAFVFSWAWAVMFVGVALIVIGVALEWRD